MPITIRTDVLNDIERNALGTLDTDKLAYLYQRWQDEKEYEDFNDYVKFMKTSIFPNIAQYFTFVKGSKRPFGLVIETIRKDNPNKYIVYSTAKEVGWKNV